MVGPSRVGEYMLHNFWNSETNKIKSSYIVLYSEIGALISLRMLPFNARITLDVHCGHQCIWDQTSI